MAGFVLVQLGTFPAAAAQPVFQVRPSLSATEVYESDLFANPSGRDGDVITRVTPAIETDHRSPLWTISSRFAADAERYARHQELTTPAARQQAALTMTYRPTPRLAVAGGADLVVTRNPQELNTATGLALIRARARRVSAHASLSRAMSPATTGALEYTFADERLGQAFRAATHALEAGAERRLSGRTTVSSRYRVHGFAFTAAGEDQAVISQSLTMGVWRAITPRVSVSVEAGPRVTGSVARPELTTSMEWTGIASNAALSYTRSQTTVIGLVGVAEIQSMNAAFGRTHGRSLDVRVAPGFFRSALPGVHAHVYVLSASVIGRFRNMFAIDLTVDGAVQEGSLYPALASQTIPRHRILLRWRAEARRSEP
ncbi:MAG TPA: hypothetical protein VK886_01420 [Vicinamibacterales bacterium]|nr:hypothetical protein [Vicinamibacterales bacterium]